MLSTLNYFLIKPLNTFRNHYITWYICFNKILFILSNGYKVQKILQKGILGNPAINTYVTADPDTKPVFAP